MGRVNLNALLTVATPIVVLGLVAGVIPPVAVLLLLPACVIAAVKAFGRTRDTPSQLRPGSTRTIIAAIVGLTVIIFLLQIVLQVLSNTYIEACVVVLAVAAGFLVFRWYGMKTGMRPSARRK